MTAPLNAFTGRQIVYTNQVPFEYDILYTNLYKMMDAGTLALAMLAPSGTIQGATPQNYFLAYNLECVPTSPATMSINIIPGGAAVGESGLGGVGVLFGYVPVDSSNYGVIASNTVDHIFKPFIQTTSNSPITLGPIANTLTPGQSVIWLVEAQPITTDANSTNRPYFNAGSPSTPTYSAANQTRFDYINYQLKMGAITSGTPVPPTADAGWAPLFNITLVSTTTTIIASNITINANAPFITESLTQKISQTTGDIRYPLRTQTVSSINYRKFSSGTAAYTPTAKTMFATVEAWGGGAGGAGATSGANDGGAGSGGGAGAYFKKLLLAADLVASMNYNVGTGGAGGGVGLNGADGTQTTFTYGSVPTTLIAGPGLHGVFVNAGAAPAGTLGGAGGAVTGTVDASINGGNGGAAFSLGNSKVVMSGQGGNSATLGVGGSNGTATSGGGTIGGNGTGFGSGGGGGTNAGNNAGSTTGGAGANGYILITEYISA